MTLKTAREKRKLRQRRVRAKIRGTAARPRLAVFRSSRYLTLQLIDDERSHTLLGLDDHKIKKGTKSERAQSLGVEAAKKILALGVKEIVFDRAGYKYHGRIKTLAEALRKGGVKF